MPTGRRLLHVVADRIRWQQALDEARRRAQGSHPTTFGNRGGGMTAGRLLTVEAAAELLSTSPGSFAG